MARIGEILVSLGECTKEAIEEAFRQQASFGARIGTNLLRMGAVHEAPLARALGMLHGVRSMSGDIRVDPQTAALITRSVAERYNVVPYRAMEREVGVLFRDPGDLRSLDDVAFALGKRVRPFVVPEARLWALMWRLYAIRRTPHGGASDTPIVGPGVAGDEVLAPAR